MTTVTFQYQTVFKTPLPPQIPPPFTGAEPRPSAPSRIAGAIIATAMCCGFVAPPTPATAAAITGSFGQYPSVTGVTLVIGGNFGTAQTQPAVAFQGGETFPDLVAKAPQAQTGSPSFVVPPGATTFSSTGEFPDLVLPLRQPPASLPSFVFYPPVATWAFSQSPEQFARPTRPIGGNEYPPQFITAVVTTTFSGFGKFQDLVQPLPRPQPTWAGFVTPPAPIAYTVTSAVDSDIVVNVNFLYQSQFNIPRTPPAAAATPSALSFTQSPSAPPRPAPIPDVLGFTTTPPTTVVVTFTGFGEFPDLLALPLRVQAPWVGFVTPPVSVTFGASGEFPDLLPQLRVQSSWVGFVAPSAPTVFTATSGEFPDFLPPLPDVPQAQPGFSFLQIAYTPSALTFSQASEQFKAPRNSALEPYSFVFNPPVATWSFGQAPEQFSKAHNPALDTQSGFSFFQIAYTPTALTFTQSPDQFAKARSPSLDTQLGFSFLQIAYNPKIFGFSQSPHQFLPSRSPSLDTQSAFSLLQIAYTPGPLVFSQSPEQFGKPRPVALDTYGGELPQPIAFVVTTPTAFGYSPSPEQFLQPRKPGLDTYSFVSTFQIAATPASLTFSQSPEQFRKPLVQSGEYTEFTALRITYTPSALTFSQAPDLFKAPRSAALEPYSFVFNPPVATWSFGQSPHQLKQPLIQSGEYVEFAALRIAYTPGPLTFSQSPDLFKASRNSAVEPYNLIFNPPVATWSFGQSPEQFSKSRSPALDTQSGFAFLQIAYTPGPLVFSQLPERFAARRSPSLDTQFGISFFQIAYTPTAFGASGEFPDLLPLLPRPVPTWAGFVTPAVSVTFGAGGTFPDLPPPLPRTQATWGGFVTPPVSVTFGATGEFPDLVLPPRAPIPPLAGFIVVSTAATTPSALSFTLSPHAFPAPVPQVGWIATALPPVAAAPVTLGFGSSPAVIRTVYIRASGSVFSPSFLPTPTPTNFGFSPSPDQLARPRKPALDTTNYSFVSTFRIAATPTAFQQPQSPEQLARPRKPGLDSYSFVFNPPRATFGFSQWPEQFLAPRKPGLDTYSFVFNPPKATFGFIQSPEQFLPFRKPALDQYSFVFLPPVVIPQTLAFTPSDLGLRLRAWPTAYIVNYSFVSAFRAAKTPTALDFANNEFFPRLQFVAVYALNQGFVTPPQVIVVPSGAGKKPKVTGVYPDAPWDAKPSKPFRPVWDKPEIKADAAPQAPAALPYPPTPPPKDLFEASQPVGARFQDLPNFDHLAPPDVPALAAQMREAQDHSDAITALQAFTEQTAAQEAASAQDVADAAAVLNALAEEISRQQTEDEQDMADAITVLTAFTTDHRED